MTDEQTSARLFLGLLSAAANEDEEAARALVGPYLEQHGSPERAIGESFSQFADILQLFAQTIGQDANAIIQRLAVAIEEA